MSDLSSVVRDSMQRTEEEEKELLPLKVIPARDWRRQKLFRRTHELCFFFLIFSYTPHLVQKEIEGRENAFNNSIDLVLLVNENSFRFIFTKKFKLIFLLHVFPNPVIDDLCNFLSLSKNYLSWKMRQRKYAGGQLFILIDSQSVGFELNSLLD